MPQIPDDEGEPIPWDEPTDDPPPPEEGDDDADCCIATDDNDWPIWVGYASGRHWRLRLPEDEYDGSPTRDACWAKAKGADFAHWLVDLPGIGATLHVVRGDKALTTIADLRDAADV